MGRFNGYIHAFVQMLLNAPAFISRSWTSGVVASDVDRNKEMTQIEHRFIIVPENNTIKHYYNKHNRLDKKLLSVIFNPDFHKMTQCLASSNQSTLR